MWNCPHCQEKVDDSFAVCWKCGADRDGNRDESFTPVDEDPSIPDLGPTIEPESSSNPYEASALLEEHSRDLTRVQQRLRTTRKLVLLLSLVSGGAGVIYLIQFGSRLWFLSIEAPEYLGLFWQVFEYLYWRLPFGLICLTDAYVLGKFAAEIGRVVTARSTTFDEMFSWQNVVWSMVAITIGSYLSNELVTILLAGGLL